MAKLVKISSNLPGIHDLKAQGNIPHPTTSPFVRLHQLQKNKERFLKEEYRLLRRLTQIKTQVSAIERELERLFSVVEKEVRPSLAGEETAAAEEKTEEKPPKGIVVEY